MRSCVALLLFAIPLTVLGAETSTYVIKQLHLEKSRVVVNFTGTLEKGTELIASFEKGKQCSLKVTAVKGYLANLDTSKCANANDLSIGQKMEPSLSVDEEQPAEQALSPPSKPGEKREEQKPVPQSDRSFHFAAGIGLQISAQKASFDKVHYTDGLGTDINGTAKFEYKKTQSLVFEGRMLPSNSWGFLFGLNYEREREFQGGVLEGQGQVITLSGGPDSSKIQFTTIYGSAAYRWSQFYIPFGLNISVAKFTPAAGYTGTFEATGSLGGQLGVGFMIIDHLAIELHSWVTTVDLKSTQGTTVVDYGTGYYSGMWLVGKFVL